MFWYHSRADKPLSPQAALAMFLSYNTHTEESNKDCKAFDFEALFSSLQECSGLYITGSSAGCTFHCRPPLWSSGRFLDTDSEVRVRFPVLPHFLRSSGSGTGSTQPREYN
jgi:hypothetical protein